MIKTQLLHDFLASKSPFFIIIVKMPLLQVVVILSFCCDIFTDFYKVNKNKFLGCKTIDRD